MQKKKKQKQMEWPLLVRLFYDILRNIVLINTNVADCDIYITAFLSALVIVINLMLSSKVLVKEA